MNFPIDRRWIFPALLLLVTDAEGTLPSANQIDRALSIGAYTPRQVKPIQGFTVSEFSAFVEALNSCSTDVQQSFTSVALEVEESRGREDVDKKEHSVATATAHPHSNGQSKSWTGRRPKGWTEENETHFEFFWKEYPRPTHKGDARKAWRAHNPDNTLARQIVRAVRWQRQTKSWTEDNGAFIPHPATWLNKGGFETEPRRTFDETQEVEIPWLTQ